ncbi:MAG TPA: hypothetical protein DD384_06665 [Firmicutes bacterium]|nr:hypothetical protein [Bacillota bacterium]
MSASILVRAFREFGIQTEGYLPSRYQDGYGLTASNVDKIFRKGYSLIFTCDNGVTAHEALKEAKKLGIEVIILDHHEFDDIPPETDIVIHPETTKYGDTAISAGYLSFVFSHALLRKMDPYLLSLGAVSTISDMMPFLSYNREIVRLMLEYMKKKPIAEFSMLTERRYIDESVFQMEIIPKINSIGRIEKGNTINRLLRYFVDRDPKMNAAISSWINEENEKRKELTKNALDELSVSPSDLAIVVQTSLPEGLNGLLASRLLATYQKPVAVFSPMEKDPSLLVGSLRSLEGVNILDVFKEINIPLLSKGGHPFAGGCSIRKEDFESFRKEYVFFALKHKIMEKNNDGIDILLNECNMKSYRLIETFSPFGLGWEAPKFLIKGLNPTTFTYLKGGKYLSIKLSEDTKIFSFSLGENSFEAGEKVNLLLNFRLNEFKGRLSLNLMAERAF